MSQGTRKTQYQALPEAAEFWADAASSKTDHALIYLILEKIRKANSSISYEQNIETLGTLKAYVDMLDLSTNASPANTEEENEDEELANKIATF
jgi:uncharacterized protein YhfF